jgi:DNA-binding response OmpR family regulator
MDGAILLIDQDLGLLFWLGRVLDHAGYQAFPARTVPDALALLGELHLTIGMLILDCSLPGAENLITALRKSRRFLRVVCLSADPHHTCVRGADVLCSKPVRFSERSKSKWLKAVFEALSASSVAS